MSNGDLERIRVALLVEARQRFGPERTQALTVELEALAVDLARVDGAPLPGDGEPGFFLLHD